MEIGAFLTSKLPDVDIENRAKIKSWLDEEGFTTLRLLASIKFEDLPREWKLAHRRAIMQEIEGVKTPPVIDLHVLYESNICNSAYEALTTDLPFKLPTLNESYVRSYGDVFELGSGDAQVCIDWWLYHHHHHVGGKSETTVTSMDSGWLGLLEIGTGCQLLRDETDESSEGATRTHATILKNGALVGKIETKYSAQHHHIALKELLDKNFIGVEKLFPMDCLQYVGIATTSTLNSINLITFDSVTQSFKSELFQKYDVSNLPQRVKFLVDIAKLGRWITGVR